MRKILSKKYVSVLLVMLLACGMMLGGCVGNNNDSQQEEQQQEQLNQEQQEGQIETYTLIGEFQGLADGHSAEVVVDGEPQVYQFFDEIVTSAFNNMNSGTQIQFDVEVDTATNVQTIVKLYDAPAQG